MTKTRNVVKIAGLMIICGSLMVSCTRYETPVAPVQGPAPAATFTATPSATPTATPRLQEVDAMEDGDGNIHVRGGRDGHWFSFVDPAGTLWPAVTWAFPMSTPGSPYSTAYAARVTGTCTQFAGMGCSMKDTPGVYDASAYSGFTFMGKVNSGINYVSVQVGTSATYPVVNGGTCVSGCYDNYQKLEILSTYWTQFTVNFSDLTQQGWGTPAGFNSTQALTLQWNLQGSGNFDLWLDEIEFIP